MDNIIFVILRKVTNSYKDSDNIWKECYKSIRKFYYNKVIIIDNNSDQNLINNDIELYNCNIINSHFYETRLLSPFLHLLNIDFDRAILIHDGVIFRNFVDFSKFKNVKFIWHFNTKKYDNKTLINEQLFKLKNNNKLLDIYNNNKFIGCMGCCLAIEKKFLTEIENNFNLSILNNIINNQNKAIAFERTISIICFTLYPNIINDLSFEGEISEMVWGFRYKDLLENKTIFNIDNKILDISNKSIIKIFGARK